MNLITTFFPIFFQIRSLVLHTAREMYDKSGNKFKDDSGIFLFTFWSTVWWYMLLIWRNFCRIFCGEFGPKFTKCALWTRRRIQYYEWHNRQTMQKIFILWRSSILSLFFHAQVSTNRIIAIKNEIICRTMIAIKMQQISMLLFF